jgi:hypothetical protein
VARAVNAKTCRPVSLQRSKIRLLAGCGLLERAWNEPIVHGETSRFQFLPQSR